MRLFGKDLSKDIAVVAEIGLNHEGDPEAAMRMLKLAAEAGADAIKFQTYTTHRHVSSADPERVARLQRFSLQEDAFRRLVHEGEQLGVTVFSTPLSEDVVPFLDTLCPVFKIASGDLTFEPVVRAAARTGKPVILSTGMATVEEIDTAVDWIREERGTDGLADGLLLMHCVSAYPTPPEQANLRSIPFLADRYGVTVGYSNHVPGSEAMLAAVALGAPVVEVHFTDRREGRTFRDHHLSLEAAELSALVGSLRAIRSMLGTHGKPVAKAEEAGRQTNRKGVVAARELPSGTVLADTDMQYGRPATDFTAAERPLLIGRRLTRSLKAGEIIPRDAVA